MALSNIFNEPRREITESVVGVGTFLIGLALTLAVLYLFSFTLTWMDKTVSRGQAIALSVIFLPATVILLIFLAIGTHNLGELICNALAGAGIELRPKKRYGKNEKG